MTNDTSANISPSLNDNNSRTVLLSSDDILTPQHRQHHHSRSSRQRSAQIHTDSTADYDEVVSHSTVQDTTPQTSSESTSMSEVPSESRFKTFVKQKKNKGVSDQSARNATEGSRLALEGTDVHANSRLLTDHYDREKLASPLVRPSNGGGQRSVHYISGSDPVHVKPLPDEPADSTVDEDEEDQHEGDGDDEERSDDGDENEDEEEGDDDEDDDDDEEEEDEEDDDDAEEGVYELSGGNVTGTGSRQRKTTDNQLSNSRAHHQSSSSQDSNGNLISRNHKQQSRPLSDQARSQLTTDSGKSHNNGDSGTAGSKTDLPNRNNHSRSRSNESAPENWRKGNDL